jgi:aminobenzoyl-glutamate utilization protein A
VNNFLTAEAQRAIHAVAALHDVRAEVTVAGAAQGAECSADLKAVVRRAAATLPRTTAIVDSLATPGSEDATFFMNAVQARGGQATYVLIGSPLAAGHHHACFDFEESALLHGVEVYAAIADQLLSP